MYHVHCKENSVYGITLESDNDIPFSLLKVTPRLRSGWALHDFQLSRSYSMIPARLDVQHNHNRQRECSVFGRIWHRELHVITTPVVHG